MNNTQDSGNGQMNSTNVFSAFTGHPLDTSLDAELSLINLVDDSWGESPPGTTYTPFAPSTQSHQKSGPATTSAPIGFSTSRFDQSNSAHVPTPTVMLQRPSIDATSDSKILPMEPLEAQRMKRIITTPTPITTSSAIADSTTTTARISNTSTASYDFGNMNLDTMVSDVSGMVDYSNRLFPLSPSGGNSNDILSAPSSPVSEIMQPDKLEYIGDGNNYYSVPVSPTLLQTTYAGDESPLSTISSASSLPPPMFFTDQQQSQQSQQSPWSTDVSQSPSPRVASPIYTSSSSTPNHFDGTEQQQQQHSRHHRSAHSAVEKKYRNNINDRITELKNAVPALRHARVKKDSAIYQDDNKSTTTTSQHNNNNEYDDLDEPVFMDGVAVATKINKATILEKATEYVYHLQQVNNESKQDIDALLHLIANQVPGGQDICDQYWQHVVQRETTQQQQSAFKGEK